MITVTSLIVKSYGSASAFEHEHIARRDKEIFVNSEINAIKAYHPRLYVRSDERYINVRTTEIDINSFESYNVNCSRNALIREIRLPALL